MSYSKSPSGIFLPNREIVPDLSAFFYFDAAGRADDDRWWGGLLAVGAPENDFLASVLHDVENRNSRHLNPKTGELKGKDLDSVEIVRAFSLLKGHQIYFWGRKMPSPADSDLQIIRGQLLPELTKLQPNRNRPSWEQVVKAQDRLREYLVDLKAVNGHKFLSLLVHSIRLIDHIRKLQIGPRLNEVGVYIDNENFPEADVCAWGLKWFLASQLQYAGMSRRLTGNSHSEIGEDGALRVWADCNSARYPGLELVDIFTHGKLRNILDFAS